MFPSVSHKSVRTVTNSVVIGGIKFKIHDRSIAGMDDPVYEADPAVWENVPRGQTVITAPASATAAAATAAAEGEMVVASVNGLRKFGYVGAPYGKPDDVETVVLIDKMNGECAHIGAFAYADVHYWIAGSKHVHIFWRDGHFAEDVSAYVAERYKYALKIAAIWSAWLDAAPADQRAGLFNYLSTTGMTACAEAILADSEHIVAYDDKDVLVFYALADGSASRTGLTATTPQHALADLAGFGLRVAPASSAFVKGSAEYVAAVDAVARRTNSEGVVAYGISAAGAVCCMWKEKSYPYIMERVVREAVIHGRVRSEIVARVGARLAEQDSSVRAYFAEWEATRFPWLLDFAEWLYTARVLPAKKAWDVQSRWLTLQRTFRTTPEWTNADAAAAACVIMFVGLPCSGKSTVARALFKLLKDAGQNPCWLNQDEAGGNRTRYLNAVKATAADPTITHVLLDKVNLEAGNRTDYSDLGLTPTMTVVYGHPDGVEAYKAVCTERFEARGVGHLSLHSTGPSAVSSKKFQGICGGMLAKATAPSASEGEILTVDVRTPAAAVALSIAAKIDLHVDADACDAAVAFSGAYEAALAADVSAGKPKPAYGGLKMSQSDLLSLLPADILAEVRAGKTLRPESHVTLRYVANVMDPIWYLAFRTKIDTRVPIKITGLVWDTHGAALEVGLPADLECANAKPHSTLAVADGIQPVYSNTLLQKSTGVNRVALDLVVDATFFFG